MYIVCILELQTLDKMLEKGGTKKNDSDLKPKRLCLGLEFSELNW